MKRLFLGGSVVLILLSSGGRSDALSLNVLIDGAGWIVSSGGGGKATFAVSGQIRQDGTIKGHLVYIDHALDLRVTSTTVTNVVAVGCQGTIEGTGESNLGPVVFSVTVQDSGEPGTSDTFSIAVTGAANYAASGILGGGNVQAHGVTCP